MTSLTKKLENFEGGGRLPNKGRYGCAGQGIGYFKGQFFPGPGIRFWEVNFARALGVWQFWTKNL